MPRSLYRLGLLLAFLVVLSRSGWTHGQQTQPLPQPETAQVTYIDVYQAWWTVQGKMTFYSETPSLAKANQVVAALAMFPGNPKTEVRGPFKRPMGTTPLFPIIFVRDTLTDGLISGKASAQGWDLGTFYENDKLRIPAGTYSATLLAKAAKGIVQGPNGQLGTNGDFLIQLTNVKNRTNIFLIAGDKPEQTNGSIMLGAPVANAGGLVAPDALKTMRLLFFDQNNTPSPQLIPNKTITVEIRDTIVRDKDTTPGTIPPR